MPDPRSVMKEFRFLEQKRKAEGLSADEQLRYGQLRDLVGGEGAPVAKPGFDVSAAAARLRESLMPAGLRNRPPPPPEPSPEPFGEIDPPADAPLAPEQGYTEQGYAEQASYPEQEQAYAPQEGEAAVPAADGLFDPGSLAEEGAYDPNAAAYDPSAAGAWDPNAAAYDPNAAAAWDPNAAAYDPNAAAAYDPNAAAYDPNAAAWDPNAAAYDPNAAAAYDPNAAAYDPNAAAAYDPNAAAYDPNAAAAYDPNAAAYDPNAAAAYDPNAAAYDPNAAAAYDPNAAAYDPNAAAAWDPNAAAYDPNAAAAWDPNAAAYDPNAAAAYDPNAAAYDPNAAAAWDPSAAAYAPEPETAPAADGTVDLTLPPEGEATTSPDAEPSWNVAAEAASAEPSDSAEPPAWAPVPGGDYDGASWDGQFSEPATAAESAEVPESAEAVASPGPIDFGSYDEAADPAAVPADLEALLPFDPAAEAHVGPDMAQTFAAGGTDLELPGADVADPNEFHAAESMVSNEAPGWQPETGAVDQGFELASGGSFDASADAAAPEWAAPPTAEAPAWDAPQPGEDLAADDGYASAPAPDPSAAASLDFSAPELTSEGDQGVDLSWAGNPGGAAGAAFAPGAHDDAFEVSEEAPEAAPAPLDLSAPDAPLPALDLAAPVLGGAEPASEDLPTLDADDMIEEVPADLVEPPEAPAYEPSAYESPPAYEPPAPEEFAAAPDPAQPIYAAPPPEPPVFEAAPPAPAAHEPELPVDVVETMPEPEVLDPGFPAEDHFVAGAHRVVVHTVEGQVKRGFIQDADLSAPELALAATQGGPGEPLPTDHVKAIFFMLAAGEQPTAPHGSRVRVTFRDGRQVAGFSPDYREGAIGFFMIPADARTSTGRIWVYSAAVKAVAVS